MTEDLQFVPLKAPLSSKALETYRKDAAWTDPLPPKSSGDARGRIQWVSITYKNKQIGIARLELAPPQFCYLSELIILSKFRGRGYGRWFMGKIEQYCLTFGIHRLLLQAGQGSESFYASQSFVADPMVPTMLRKDLNPFQRKMFVPGR